MLHCTHTQHNNKKKEKEQEKTIKINHVNSVM
jgi:hypothetical protein